MDHIIDILETRGLIEGSTGVELYEAARAPLSVYCGFDPTADSLHLGHLMALVVLGWFRQLGHQVVVLVGGATGMIGDPSGKDRERPVLTEEAIEENLLGIRKDLTQVFERLPGSYSPKFLNNHQWFGRMGLVEFLQLAGRYLRMGPLLGKEMVRRRLASEEGLSYAEFSYQLIQAYDFLHLFQEEGVVLQIGGSDQWGNITAGIELVRKVAGKSAHGLTFPLLTRADGKKFGKSEQGAVWLSESRYSAYDFYQYLVRLPDEDVIRLMRALTYLPLSEIHELERGVSSGTLPPNVVQKKLAFEVTQLVHGEKGVEKALAVTQQMSPGHAMDALDVSSLAALAQELPNIEFSKDELFGQPLYEILRQAGLVKSKGEGRKLIRNGGGYLNGVAVANEGRIILAEDLIDEAFLVVGAGKKRKVVIRLFPSI